MKVNDFIRATWPDGMVCFGRYDREERGYIILLDKDDEQIVCNKSLVDLEILQSSEQESESVS